MIAKDELITSFSGWLSRMRPISVNLSKKEPNCFSIFLKDFFATKRVVNELPKFEWNPFIESYGVFIDRCKKEAILNYDRRIL